MAGAGAGVVIDTGHESKGGRRPFSRDDAPRIAEAIETVRGGPSYRENARRIADEMAAAPTVDALLDKLMTTRHKTGGVGT